MNTMNCFRTLLKRSISSSTLRNARRWTVACLIGLMCTAPAVAHVVADPEVLTSGMNASSVAAVDASHALFEDRVEISWTAEVSDAAIFRVLRDGVLLSILASNERRFADRTGNPGTDYEYCVVASLGGVDSEPVCDTGRRIIFPVANLTATEGSFDQFVQLVWADRSEVEAEYHVYRDGDLLVSLPADYTIHRDDTAEPGDTYQYCVAAVDGNGFESTSVCAAGWRGFVLPPRDVVASDGQFPDFTRLTWADQTRGRHSFRIVRKVAGSDDSPALLTQTAAGAEQYDDAAAVNGVTYQYCVVTVNEANQESIPVCDTGGRGVLAVPQDVSATYDVHDDYVAVTWSDTPTEDAYHVFRRDLSSADSVLVGEVSRNVTRFDDFDAEPGVEYRYCVVAVTDEGAVSAPNCSMGRRSMVLAPEDFTASKGDFEGHVLLRWASMSTRAVLFKLFREGELIKTLSASQTDHADLDIASGVDYEYCLQAVTALGVETDLVCDIGSREIRAPSGVTATMDEYENRVVISWTDNSEVETGYRILRLADGSPEPDLVDQIPANRTSYSDRTGAPGTLYEYFVVAIDALGASAPGSATGRRTLKPPSGFTASQGKYEDRIALTWTDNSAVEEGYRIYRKRSADGEDALSAIGETEVNAMEFHDASVDFGASYDYRVAAFDAHGESEFASASGFTTILAPRSFSASGGYTDRVVLTWVPASEVAQNYRITRDGAEIASPSAAASSYTDHAAQAGVTHRYCIVSVTGDAESESVCSSGLRVHAPVASQPGLVDQGAPTSLLGTAMHTDGSRLIVGASGMNSNRGEARIYERSGGTWVQVATLTAADGVAGDHFGFSVAINGDVAIVGAPEKTRSTGSPLFADFERSGAVYIFRREADGNWIQIRRLFETDAWGFELFTANRVFGQNVVATDDYLGTLSRRPGDSGVSPTIFVLNRTGHLAAFLQLSGQVNPSSLAAEANRIVAGATTPGSAFVWKHGVNISTWDAAQEVRPQDAVAGFGRSVAIHGEFLSVGATDGSRGSVYVFRDAGSSWNQLRKLTAPERVDGAHFGWELDLTQDLLLVGAHQTSTTDFQGRGYVHVRNGTNWTLNEKFPNGAGSRVSSAAIFGETILLGGNSRVFEFPIHILIPPGDVTASDGTHNRRIEIRWQDLTENEDGFRVYRDDRLIATTAPGVRSFNDEDAPAGGAYDYCVTAFIEGGQESVRNCDIGWRPADGHISGRVASQAGPGIQEVDICLDPVPGRSALFDGSEGYLGAGDVELNNRSFSIEFWARRAAGGSNHYAIGQGHASSNSGLHIGFRTDNRFTFAFFNNDLNTPPQAYEPGWIHWTVTFDNSTRARKIYQNGDLVAEGTAAAGYAGTGELFIGKGFAEQYFDGQLDEIRIWSTVRTAEEIAEHQQSRLLGNEQDLLAYWSFNLRGERVAADQRPNGHNGRFEGGVYYSDDTAPVRLCAVTDQEGNYDLPGLSYGAGTTFRVTPQLGARIFEPAFKTITLNAENPVQNEVGFIDVSSFAVSGSVRLEGMECPAQNVEILIDGEPVGLTDRDGLFSVPADIGKRVVSARMAGHVFSPAQIEIDVAGNVANLEFRNTTRRTMTVDVGGGCGFPAGTATVNVFTENNCIQQSITADSAFELSLPPQAYFVEVSDVSDVPGALDPVDVIRFFEQLGAQEVDLTDEDHDVSLIYRAPLRIAIDGFPGSSCQSLTAGSRNLAPAFVVAQGDLVNLNIDVFEDYGSGNLCPLDSGQVAIYDEVIDRGDEAVMVEIKDGIAQYQTAANTPNIAVGRRDAQGRDRSHQKAITAVVDVPGRGATTLTEWVLVTGHRPRTATFTSVSEGIPIVILRDPPGTNSFASLERGEKICRTISEANLAGLSATTSLQLKLGKKFEAGTPFFSQGTEISVTTKGSLEIGVEATLGNRMQLCATVTEKFSTSDGMAYVGEDADVFVGVALNMIFATTDVLDLEGCDVVRSESVALDVDDFETTYAYTQGHIRDVVIPQLEFLAATDPENAFRYESAVENWQAHLDLNADLKREAEFVRNRSFSAGTAYEFSHTTEEVETHNWEVKVFSNAELSITATFEHAGSGVEGQFVAKMSYAYTRGESEETTATQTVGYTLKDDDLGDFFSVDIRNDPAYGTPVFDVLSGRSSCPWEPWYGTDGEPRTQPRYNPQLTISPPVLYDVPPDKPAVFTLGLTNLSEADEEWEHTLRSVQPSNPGGAILNVNGSGIAGGQSFFLKPGQTQEATLSVQRGPNRFTYDSLAIVMYAPCEYENYQNGVDFSPFGIDTLYFSVRYKAPCSDITLFRPLAGWRYNAEDRTAGKKLDLLLADFKLQEADAFFVERIGAQYRLQGTSEWINIPPAGVPFGQLTEGRSETIQWDIAGHNIPDGTYDLRAYTQCPAGFNYSLTATGVIDTRPPVVFGTPQPADGVLALGQDISVTFDEPIRCSSATPGNISLAFADTDNPIELTTTCSGRTVIIKPKNVAQADLEGRELIATVSGVKDIAGNVMEGEVSWSFEVRQSIFTWTHTQVAHEAPFRNPGVLHRTLVNGSNTVAEFQVIEVPEWLVPEIGTGTVQPGGELEMTFHIDENLGIGSYGGVVRVGSNTGDAVFNIHLNVVCRAPAWTINPAQFEHSMNVVAQLLFDDLASSDTNDRLAAFVGNQLRGVGNVTFDSGLNSHLVYLTVYSNLAAGETVRFQAYNAADCRLYNGTDQSITFASNGIAGNPQNPIQMRATDVLGTVAQTMAVNQGWTWISTNVSSTDMTVAGILSDLNPADGDLIKSQVAFSQFDESTGWTGSLLNLDNRASYMIRMSAGGAIHREGTIVDPTETTIEVVRGWNWIGYLNNRALTVSDAMEDFDARDGDIIKSQHAFAQYVGKGSTRGWFGNLQSMEPGMGYRLYADKKQEFRYPANTPDSEPALASNQSADGTSRGTGAAETADPGWHVDAAAFQHNMTLTAVVEVDGRPAGPQHTLGAFVDGELRGAATAQFIPALERYFWFLVIHANQAAGETVAFQVHDGETDELLEVTETTTFEADRVAGTIAEPFRIGSTTATSIESLDLPETFSLAQNYPNPFNPTTQIRYGLPQDVHVTVRIFDVLGREVQRLVDEEQKAGWYTIRFDGSPLASGVYIYQIEAGDFQEVRRMVLVK